MSRPLSMKILGKKGTGKRALRLFTDEDKDDTRWLSEKVLEMSKDKVWKNCDPIYWISVIRKDKFHKSSSDRYLFLFYNPEVSDGFLVNVSCKGKDVSFKKSWPLSDIKSVDFQENSNIFKISLEHDYTWSTVSNIERDEALWIIIHVCKYLCSNDIKVKSTMSIKVLGLALTTNKTLSKFTKLHRLLDDNMDTEYKDLLGNDLLTFTPEETDAEKLFDELHWGGDTDDEIGDPVQLQKCLHKETESLFVEICDFLLQWEEDEEKEAIIKEFTGRDAMVSDNSNSSVRETFELLTSLDNVDSSLANVENWLNEQVTHLSDVQSQLFQIESENSGLETSWHNLTAVKALITSIVNGPLNLHSNDEEKLRNPHSILHEALHENKSLQNTAMILLPLVEAINSLRDGLKMIDGKKTEFTSSQWRQIQTMTVISEHRQKLHQLTSDLCNNLVDFSHTLFKTLVQHKALKPVRRLSFTTIVNSVKVMQGNFKLLTAEGENGLINVPYEHQNELEGRNVANGSLTITPPDSTSTGISDLSLMSSRPPEGSNVLNQIASAQREYHRVIFPFYPLLASLSELSPSLQENLRESYITYTEKYLFSSLFKEAFKELIDALVPRQSKDLALATMPKCLAKKLTTPALRFQHPSICRSGSPLALSPWTVFSSIVRLADEVIHCEHEFISRTILHLEKRGGYSVNAEERIGERALSKMFHVFREKTLKLVSSADYTDGIEIVAMLVTINMMIAQRITTASWYETENLSNWNISMEEFTPNWDYLEEILLECKKILTTRLDDYVSSQVANFREKKVDQKKICVLSPVSRFPYFIDQMQVFSGSKSFDFIDAALEDIGSELVAWVQTIATRNEKYCDVILIHNLEYLVQALSVRPEVTALDQLSSQAQQDKEAAEGRYIKWMIAYEFPKYASLAERINDLGRRATSDQLGLYIRRDEVSKAVSKMDRKNVESAVNAVRKRLDKHFLTTAEVAGLNSLIASLWDKLRTEICNVFGVIERVAKECYQINLIVDETYVREFCQKIT